MNIILYYIAVATAGLAISPFIRALIERFSKEQKVFTKEFADDIKFDWKVALFVSLSFIAVLFYFGPGLSFVLNAFISVILIISFFVDIKAQIIPNETNLIGLIVGAMMTCYYFTKDYSLRN